jgi:hypothetical protein
MKLIVALVVAAATGLAIAQNISDVPRISTCMRVLTCDDGIASLSPEQTKTLNEILKVVRPRATQDAISKAYHFKEGSATPSMPARGYFENKPVHKAIWYVTDKRNSLMDPNLDVLFVNGEAASFRWYFEGGVLKYVQVIYISD